MIRKAQIPDAVLLAQLSTAVQAAHASAQPDVFKPASVSEEIVQWFAERLGSPTFDAYLGELAGEAIGYIATEKINRPETPFTYSAQSLLIDQMSVNPSFRSKGYGAQLLHYVCALAEQQGFERVVLNVWGFNARAQRFYERCGFKVRDIRYEISVTAIVQEEHK